MKDKRLYHSVAEKITKLIDDGRYPPGSRLPGERELAEQLDVSRVTIREAEIMLQALGYISIKTGSGAYVLDPAGKRAQELPNVSAFELAEARALFESEAAALAASQITDETLERLEELIATLSNEDAQGDEASRLADREFHIAIAASSGNSAVKFVVETLWKMRTELPAVREVHDAICHDEDASDRGAEHAEVLNALRNRDPSAARLAMHNHFRRLLKSMIDATEERELEELRRKATQTRHRYLNSIANSRSEKQAPTPVRTRNRG